MPDKKSDPVDMNFIDVEPLDNSTESITSPDTQPPKKKNIVLILVISLVAALILIAGSVFAFNVFFNGDAKAPTVAKETPPQSNEQDTITAKILVANTVAALQGVKNPPADNKGSASYPVFAAPVYRPSGYEFSVRPSEDYGFYSTGTKEAMVSDLAKTKDVLSKNKLVETIFEAGDAEAMYIAGYESDTITCILTDQKPYQASATSENFSVTLGCADKVAYNDNAKLLKPYFDVYKNQSEYDTSKLAMNSPVVKESSVKGYSRATVGIGGSEYNAAGGFAGLFYTTPDGALRFFKGTQSQIPCEDFNTDDIRKAYAGESCYDEMNEAAVVNAE